MKYIKILLVAIALYNVMPTSPLWAAASYAPDAAPLSDRPDAAPTPAAAPEARAEEYKESAAASVPDAALTSAATPTSTPTASTTATAEYKEEPAAAGTSARLRFINQTPHSLKILVEEVLESAESESTKQIVGDIPLKPTSAAGAGSTGSLLELKAGTYRISAFIDESENKGVVAATLQTLGNFLGIKKQSPKLYYQDTRTYQPGTQYIIRFDSEGRTSIEIPKK